MRWRNPFDVEPIRPAARPGDPDPTGELEPARPDPLLDAERPPPAPAGEPLAVEFLGEGAEYARIWYVNLLLTLASLGLYSPWARVASRRYFASRSLIGGMPLAYHGGPLPVLKGRLLAVVVILAGWTLTLMAPVMEPIVLATAILAAPWFVLRTFEFSARNHSWRGIRFGFAMPWRAAVVPILPLLLWPASTLAIQMLGSGLSGHGATFLIVAVGAFGAYKWPWAVATATQLRFKGTRYGTARFTLDATPQDFFRVYSIGLGPRLGAAAASASAVIVVAMIFLPVDVAAIVFTFAVLCATALTMGASRGSRYNLGLHRLAGAEGRIRFRSVLEPKAFALLYLRNALWVVATLGLAWPWRRVLTARFRLSKVTVYVDGSLAMVRADGTPVPGAFGEALAEDLGLDLSL